MRILPESRQPFLGLALAAATGIAIGDLVRFPESAFQILVGVAVVCTAVLLWRPNNIATYASVCVAFCLLHNIRTAATPGLSLAERLGQRPRVVIAEGTVVSEPKTSGN